MKLVKCLQKTKSTQSHPLRIFICDTYNHYIFQHIYTHLNIYIVNNNVEEKHSFKT